MAAVKIREGFKGCLADTAVGILEIFLDAVQVDGLAVELDLAGSHDLLIFIAELSFFLHQRDVLLAEAFLGQVRLNEILFSESLFNVRPEGAGLYCIIKSDVRGLQGRQHIVQILVFFLVKLIGGIDGMADHDDGNNAVDLGFPAVVLINSVDDLLTV